MQCQPRRDRPQPLGLPAGAESAQVTDAVSGFPSGSSPIRLCIAVLNDSPAIGPGSSATTARTVSTTASKISSGSCSA